MYKDKEKQKQVQRERTRRYRAKQKGVTEGVTEGVTSEHPDTAPTTQNTDEHEDAQGTKSDEVIVEQTEQCSICGKDWDEHITGCPIKHAPAQSTKSDKVMESIAPIDPTLKGKFIEHTRTASLQDYRDNPDDYVQYLDPERLNWGHWMNTDKLRQAGFRANRLSIPGDWDYMHGSVEVEK